MLKPNKQLPSNSLLRARHASGQSDYRQQQVALIIVYTLAFLAYAQVMFNFFLGDDFVHLVWLKRAAQQPDLIMRNFQTSWLEGGAAKFYRPLISVFMVIDYRLWGTNGFGFHLTNIVFLLAGSTAVFFIMRKLLIQTYGGLSAGNADNVAGRLWTPLSVCPFMASLIFALYPLHAEAVSWITGRVDSVVTAFSLASILTYMHWTGTKSGPKRTSLLIASIGTMILALLSKEMAVVVPLVVGLYEFLIGDENGRWPSRCMQAVKKTLPFWLVLAAYFGVRYVALGTFVGGYGNCLSITTNWPEFLSGWMRALGLFLAPINHEIMGKHNLWGLGWKAAIALCGLLLVRNCVVDASVRRIACFLLAFTAISFLPVYKLLPVMADNLQGSRFAYLASAPLACLIALAYAESGTLINELFGRVGSNQAQSAPIYRRLIAGLSALALVSLPVLAFVILTYNNSAWAKAGQISNDICTSVRRFYDSVPGDPLVLIVGLPDRYRGAYVARNALHGMTKTPMISRDVANCLMIEQCEQILPVGYLKESIAACTDKVRVLRWNENTHQLAEITGSGRYEPEKLLLAGSNLLEAIEPIEGTCTRHSTTGSSITIEPNKGVDTIEMNIEVPHLRCFGTNFIAVQLDVHNLGAQTGADLFYRNQYIRDFDFLHRSHCRLDRPGNKQTLIFTLRAAPEWVFGDYTDSLKLAFPGNTSVTIKSIEVVPPERIMPKISFANSGLLESKGYASFAPNCDSIEFQYDTSGIPGASGIVAEINRQGAFYPEMNTSAASDSVMKEWQVSGTIGTLRVHRQDFHESGLFGLRLWSINSSGQRLGVAGDHVTISVH